MADNIRATPQNPYTGKLASALRRMQQFAGQYQVDPRVPLLGGTSVDELLSLPGTASLMEDVSYNGPRALIRGGNAATGGIGTFKLDPRILDTAEFASNVSPLAVLAGKGATRGALAAGRAGERLAERVVPQVMGRNGMGAQLLRDLSQGSGANVIKPRGGNWLAGSVEESLRGLKHLAPAEGPFGDPVPHHLLKPSTEGASGALNNWIDKQLTRYVQKDMATPEDPIRALAEQGVLHVNPEELQSVRAPKSGPAELSKKMGKSDVARDWENASDSALSRRYFEQFSDQARPKWLKPGVPVYGLEKPDNLGFNHLIDELRNAVNPESGLPRELLLKYSSLPQVSVPQAVQRVADINAWREAQSALARKSAAEGIPVRKEYPEGYRWLSVPDVAADEKALKYAVDVGCEGGWCTQSPETAKRYGGGEGGRLHLLVDKEGNPRVQIHEQPESMNSAIVQMDPEYQAFAKSLAGKDNYEKELLLREYVKENPPPARITQIKGKQNRAPNPEYLPYVQDFVKSGQWSDVGDLRNAGLRDISGWRGQVLDYGADPTKAEAFFSRLPNRYASQSELDELMGPLGGDYTFSSLARYINNPPPAPGMALPPEPGFATGGLVQKFGKGGVVKAALEEARDTVLKLKQLRDSGQLDWQSIAQDIPTRFYRGMANMVRGDEASPKFLEDLTEKYLGSQEPLPGVTSLAGQLRPAAALSDVQNMRKNMAWAASNPLTAATYAESPNSVMIPLDLVRKPEAIFDAKGAPWQRFFSQTGRLTQSGKLPLDSRFRDALRDPEVKSILVKNIYDKGIGSANELSSLYGLDIFPEDFVSTNLLIKDPSAVRYAISGETPLLKEPKLKKAEGGLVQHSYDPAKIDALTQQLQEELNAA